MNKDTIILCAYCGIELDISKDATTCCSKCDNTFCCNLATDCVVKYHQENDCEGRFTSILDPSWVMNLYKPKE